MSKLYLKIKIERKLFNMKIKKIYQLKFLRKRINV